MNRRILTLLFVLLAGGLTISPAAAQTNVLDVEVLAVFQSEDSIRVAVNETGSTSIEIYDGIGNLIKRLEPNFDLSGVITFDWNADGTRLAVIYTGSEQLNVAVWDVATSTVIAEQKIDFVQFAYWHPVNPDVLMIVLGTTIKLWDLSTGSGLTTYDPDWVGIEAVQWSPSGVYIGLIGNGANFRIIHAQTQAVIFEKYENLPWPDRMNVYFSFAFSPSDDRVALYDLMNTEIEIWDIATNHMELEFDSFDTSSQHYEIVRWLEKGLVGIDFRLEKAVLYNPSNGTFEPIFEGVRYSGAYFPSSGDAILFVPLQVVTTSPFFVEVELPD